METARGATGCGEAGGDVVAASPGMLMIGSAGKKSGKTTLACALIRREASVRSVTGAKVVAVHERGEPCPHGKKGCGVCSSLVGPYQLTRERGEAVGKDTTRLYESGADPVYWLCVRPRHLAEGAAKLLDGLEGVAVVESNSLRKVVEPDLFLVAQRAGSEKLKPSCRDVSEHIDEVVTFDGEGFSPSPDSFSVVDGRWAYRREATAIVLAGGRSQRMGTDKALLDVGGKPMIRRIVEQLEPHFEKIIVSANDPTKYEFLGLDIVPDRSPDEGPMMAIASALARSEHEVNLVVPCDIPTVPSSLMLRLLRIARTGLEIVVPVNDEHQYEPLFAVYRRNVAGRLDEALAGGERRIATVYGACETREVPLRRDERLRNVNTREDYAALRGTSS